jgi:hypothetical protein
MLGAASRGSVPAPIDGAGELQDEPLADGGFFDSSFCTRVACVRSPALSFLLTPPPPLDLPTVGDELALSLLARFKPLCTLRKGHLLIPRLRQIRFR